MTKIKRILTLTAIFTAAAITLSGCKTTDSAVNFYEYEDILSETGEVMGINITGCSYDIEEIRVPEAIGGKKVLQIGYRRIGESSYQGAFESCPLSVKRILIPEGVEWIYGGAFSNSISIENIYLPESLISLGPSNFAYCEGLTDIEIPKNITELTGNDFLGCISLEQVTLPEGLTYIGHLTFGSCESLEKIKLPSTVTSIETYAFQNCTSLSEISLPDGLLSIGEMAFDGCEKLTDVTVPDTVETIGRDAFNGCLDIVVHYRGMSYTYPELFNIYTIPEGDELPEWFIPNMETE